MYPPFYYRFCGYDHYCDTFVFCIFPFNYFVRIWRAFRYYQKEKWYYLGYKAKRKMTGGQR